MAKTLRNFGHFECNTVYRFLKCCTLLYIHSSFAIILKGKRELVALLSLSPWCLVIDVWPFLAVQWVCLLFVIVVFPDHIHFFCYFVCNTVIIALTILSAI